MRTDNYRNFKKNLGELIVTSSVIYCCIQETTKSVEISDAETNQKKWEQLAKFYDICLNQVDSNQFNKRVNHLLFLNIHSAFDEYFDNYKNDFAKFKSKNWQSESKESIMDQIKRNLGVKNNAKYEDIDLNVLLEGLKHYRSIRNKIAHTSKDESKKDEKLSVETIMSLKSFYKLNKGPNTFDELGYGDVRLYSRMLLDFCSFLDFNLRPSDSEIIRFLPSETISKYKNLLKHNKINKAENYLASCLQNYFGLELEICRQIVCNHKSLLA